MTKKALGRGKDRDPLHLITDRLENVWSLIDNWQKAQGSGPVQRHFHRVFAATPNVVETFLAMFVGAALNTRLDQNAYDTIVRFSEPEDVLAAIKACGLLAGTRTDEVSALARDFDEINTRSGTVKLPEALNCANSSE